MSDYTLIDAMEAIRSEVEADGLNIDWKNGVTTTDEYDNTICEWLDLDSFIDNPQFLIAYLGESDGEWHWEL